MGGVYASSEGVPGGLSAGGQRRKMAGCGAQVSSVSRLYPSILQIFPAKRLERWSTALIHSLIFFSFSFWLWNTQFHLHACHTDLVLVIICLQHKFETWAQSFPVRYWSVQNKSSELSYYKLPVWLYSVFRWRASITRITSQVVALFSFPRFLASSLSVPFWLTLEFPSEACLLVPHSQSISCLSKGNCFSSVILII